MDEKRELDNRDNKTQDVVNKIMDKTYIGKIYESLEPYGSLRLPIISVLVTTFITIMLFILYGIGYTFLYGFYFGGTTRQSPSLLETFIFPVPFEFNSVIIVGIILLIGVILFVIFTNEIRLFTGISNEKISSGKKKQFNKQNLFFTIVAFILFHFVLSLFFLSALDDADKIFSFIGVWIGPFIISVSIVWLVDLNRDFIMNTLEFIASFVIITVVGSFIISFSEESIKDTWFSYYDKLAYRLNVEKINLYFLAIFIFAFFINRGRKFYLDTNVRGFLYRLAIVCSFSFIVNLLIYGIFKEILHYDTILFILFFTMFCSLFIAGLFPLFNFINFSITRPTKVLEENKNKDSKKIIVFLIPVISAVVLLTIFSIQSFETGKYLRKTIIRANGYKENKNYLVETIIYSNENECLNGFVVTADKNGVYYISNEDWKLVTLKNMSIRTQPISNNESSTLICRKKLQ
ncbi:hypothetical protein AM501_24900 [Aneurinibacillus migulanus]|uniref:hypothetical protein n=1 Tax=Aneurinibacillus migulanus TaxID=47500 RepID=UPI0005BC6148|nr:hypothetical protein [Aneurinibacillus migulanus]KIV58370.1 hypothetical protein TS64_04730 [Aneurinibacillus migulanus]KPD05686.1 hypothetical protein AM501_24900 [Aneurinibacillus migulanus]